MPIYPLRNYQHEAVTAIERWVEHRPDEHCYVKAPGGSGKSLMIAATAEFCYDKGHRVIVLVRSEKLLTQNCAKFHDKYAQHIGIYSASLNQYDLDKPITIATIQSIYNKPIDASKVICDETHNINPDDEGDTQYWKFFRALGNPQIIGFTASDYRLGSGLLKFGRKIYDIPIDQLVKEKHIIPPTNKLVHDPDVSKVQIIRHEYNEGELESIYLEPELLGKTIEVLQAYTTHLHSVVIFVQSRKHGKVLREAMADNGMESVFVDAETNKKELSKILTDFENLKIKYLINVGLLVEGWDCPSIDCVCIFLKTLSKAKFEQMGYRGTRPAPSLKKDSFLILDMGGNFYDHGELGSPYIETPKGETRKHQGKICPNCEEFVKPKTMECPNCGYVFPPIESSKVTHDYEVDTQSNMVYSRLKTFEVTALTAKIVKSKSGNDMIRVDYFVESHKYKSIPRWLFSLVETSKFLTENNKEMVSPLHTYSLDDLCWHINQLPTPKTIQVDMSGKFPKVVK
jgi:DNA repair protein RadD